MIIPMPILGHFRGRPLHQFQSPERVERIVCREIDEAHAVDDNARLLEMLRDYCRSPESRILCAERLLLPAEEREAGRRRAQVDVTLVRALRVGLDNLLRADPRCYNSIYHVGGPDAPQPPRRPEEYRLELLAAQQRAKQEDAR